MTIQSIFNVNSVSNIIPNQVEPIQNGLLAGSQPTVSVEQPEEASSSVNGGKAKSETTSAFDKLLDDWKQHAIQPNLSVQFARDAPTNEIWMNLVDNSTGQVVYKFPPEAMRMLKEHKQANGLVTDVRT
ncbi:flagellar protein FlaG [Alicyclobacillus acidoterrestris]|uniref:Flagellar protein FlaG n=1 Tax=Alicyclobacillus acidoterrestris (strain ATCC 49025 / DSM 3922 / CIP 106132 / NCIMB 13137 / GD3B) TaxID=1356854 RepID=T0D0P0_ALIAG|nr:flagellar protein FlaG [Alicyclobacillus acidoterrestris]EPZ43361.1 hypothetical protein N007_13135 [Alicyclobacillus acidoterrestris ATCC 49025]UNO48796.1 flagellar protein FlaG [Alicyclobacillus acidoterrestris]